MHFSCTPVPTKTTLKSPPTPVRLVKEWILMLLIKKQLIWKLFIYWYLMSFFYTKNVTKCLGHHYAIWTSDSNFSLARTKFRALPFVIFWLPLFYILITPLLSSDYPFYTFWLPLCYLLITPFYILITPLLSSDYNFVIFWLPLWYLLITPLLSSDYAFGTFWLHLWYLRITPLVSSDYAFCICWLPTWYLELPRYDNLRNIIIFDGVHRFIQQIHKI